VGGVVGALAPTDEQTAAAEEKNDEDNDEDGGHDR
jgi:hypothetical protein